jgi:hypothetical protein
MKTVYHWCAMCHTGGITRYKDGIAEVDGRTFDLDALRADVAAKFGERPGHVVFLSITKLTA